MKKVIYILFVIVYMTWNFPFVLFYMIVALWHWDWSYVNDFGDKMAEIHERICPFKEQK